MTGLGGASAPASPDAGVLAVVRTASASAAWVSGAWGAKVAGEVPRTPAFVTARICGAAQLRPAAPAAVHAKHGRERDEERAAKQNRHDLFRCRPEPRESHPPKGEPAGRAAASPGPPVEAAG